MASIDVCRLKISQIRALVAIADEGTFGKAALQLDISQSAVSHAISTMEETLGVSLLNRGRQGAALTPVGEEIANEARQVLASLERIGKTATSARGLETGQVRVACFRSVATHLMPSIIGQFQQRHPDIKVIITEHGSTDTIENDVLMGQADIGFVLLPTKKNFETRVVLRDEYVVLLPPTENPPAKLTWEQLEQYPLILPPRHVTCCAIVRENFERYHRPFNLAYEITEDSTILSMVMQGLGATVMARLAADPIPKGLRIAYPPEPMERVIGVAISAEALHPPAVYALWETLQSLTFGAESWVA